MSVLSQLILKYFTILGVLECFIGLVRILLSNRELAS